MKLNTSLGLNTSINNQYLTSQTHHNVLPINKQYQPHNIQYSNINTITNTKSNYQQHGIHSTVYSGGTGSMGNSGTNYSPFTIKNNIPQHLYRPHDNVVTIKQN